MNHWGLVALAAFAVYLTALPNGLVYDDLQVIPGNRLVEHPGDVWAIFTGPYRIGQQAVIGLAYRPLTVWSFGWNFGINELAGLPGDSPFGFHLLNVILHAATCIVLYAMCLRLGLGGWTGLGASLLFAVHPVHTEAVTAVVNRSEILAALFGLLFLLLHRDRRRLRTLDHHRTSTSLINSSTSDFQRSANAAVFPLRRPSVWRASAEMNTWLMIFRCAMTAPRRRAAGRKGAVSAAITVAKSCRRVTAIRGPPCPSSRSGPRGRVPSSLRDPRR